MPDQEPTSFEERRQAAGRRIAADPENFRMTKHGIDVRSESGRERWYHCLATADEYHCECEDHQRNGSKCKHVYGAELRLYGEFLPEPEPPLAFERLGDRIISVLDDQVRHSIAEERYTQIVGDIRAFQKKHRDLLHLILYIERGMINRSYVSSVLADFVTGAASLKEIQEQYSLY